MMKPHFLDYFRDEAIRAAQMSKDANTKVGACIFDEEHLVSVSNGWNDIPRGVVHSEDRSTRPLKYQYITHAEANAVANAARMGRATFGKSIVVTMYPCSRCAGLIINAGIQKVYSPPPDFDHAKYGEDFRVSQIMFAEARIDVVLKE